LGSDSLDRLNRFRACTTSQLRPKPKARTSLTIDAMMSRIRIRNPLMPTGGSDPGCGFIETLLRLLQHGVMIVYVKLDADSSSECFVHERSIAEDGTKVKEVSAYGQPFLDTPGWKPGVSKNGGQR
jgi:hypothetical protein